MASVAVFEPGKTPEYHVSVNTPEYEGNPNAIINPDISGVQNVLLKFWKKVNSTIVEMSQAEKNAVLLDELLKKEVEAENYNVNLVIALTALIKVINIRLPSGQKITKSELVQALKDEIV